MLCENCWPLATCDKAGGPNDVCAGKGDGDIIGPTGLPIVLRMNKWIQRKPYDRRMGCVAHGPGQA